MRTTAAFLLFGVATLALGPNAPRAVAQGGATLEVDTANGGGGDFRLFYDKLADGGSWLQTEQYGYVFQPQVAAQGRDWRPYTEGYWAQTDQGWTWVSNEDFGWACYHYGRWANLVDTGWVWVPGAEWAPAYVSWRFSKDHKTIGWAPLPPEARVTKTSGVERWADSAYDIGPESYNFIETTRIGDDTYRGHLLSADRVTTVFTESENVTSVTYRTVSNRSVIYNGGPDVTVIREVSGRPVRELRLDYQERPVDYFGRGDGRSWNSVNGNTFVVAAASPDVIRSTSIQVTQPRNVTRRIDRVEVDRGYRGLRNPQEADRIRASIRTQTPAPPEVERQTATLRERGGNRRDVNAGAGPATPNGAAPAPSPAASLGRSPAGQSGATPAPERNPAAAGQTPPAPASPSPAAEATPRNPRPGAGPKDTPAPTSRPEASSTPRREAVTPAPSEATLKPSTTPAEDRRERQGGTNRPQEKATPAERENARPQATPANRNPEAAPRKATGNDAPPETPRGEKTRPEATPARPEAGSKRGEDEAGPAKRRETPAPTRNEAARPETPTPGGPARPEPPARRPETERPERGGAPRGGGAERGAGAGERGKGEKKADAEAPADGKAKPTPQP